MNPLLILHGFTGSGAAMALFTDLVSPVRTVIALDLIGHGANLSHDSGRYSMAACVEDVVDQLGERSPVDVFGYSMGARVALSLAVAHPDVVSSLRLVGVSAGIADPVERDARVRADHALAERIEDDLESFVDDWMAQPLFASQAALGAEYLARARAQRLDNDPIGLAHSLREMGTGAMPPLFDALSTLRCPVTLIAGALDTKFIAIAHDLAARLPNARVEIIPGVGHAAHVEAPSLVLPALDHLSGS